MKRKTIKLSKITFCVIFGIIILFLMSIKAEACTPIAGMSVVLEEFYEKEPTEAERINAASKIDYEFSNEELEVFYRIVEAEATGGGLEEKENVAHVILNRLKSDSFPDTIEEIVFQKNNGVYQFSPILDKRYWKVEITDSTKEAVKNSILGEDTVGNALYFCAYKWVKNGKTRSWFDSLTITKKDNIHHFYK